MTSSLADAEDRVVMTTRRDRFNACSGLVKRVVLFSVGPTRSLCT